MTEPAPPSRPRAKQTGVPRRFGAGTLLVIMTMYAVLFTAMQQLPAVFFVVIATFFTGVGFAQAILYKGRDPRTASILTGMFLYPLLLCVILAYGASGPLASEEHRFSADLSAFLLTFYYFSGFGAGAGYLAGGLIAGVFLLFNKVQPPLADPDEEPAPPPSPPGKKTGVFRRFVAGCAVLVPRKPTGVPRRFGVAVMLVIMTMYAVLFAVMQKLPALFFVGIATFFTGVGLGQAILYEGRSPRKASAVTGMVLYPVLLIVGAVIMAHNDRTIPDPSENPLLFAVVVVLAGFLVAFYFLSGFGAGAGYLAGGLIAGVFLLFNKVQPPLDDPEEESDAEKAAPDAPTGDAPSVP